MWREYLRRPGWRSSGERVGGERGEERAGSVQGAQGRIGEQTREENWRRTSSCTLVDDACSFNAQQRETDDERFIAYRRWKGRELTRPVAESGGCVLYGPAMSAGKTSSTSDGGKEFGWESDYREREIEWIVVARHE